MVRWFSRDSCRVRDFYRSLRRGHRLWEVGLAITGQALVGAVVVCITDLVLPEAAVRVLVFALVWLVGVAVWTAVSDRAPVAVVDRELGLGDRLLTYLGLERRRRGCEMSAFELWLQADLESKLAAVPPSQSRRLWRRPLGSLRYLIPVLVLLLLLRFLAPLPSRPEMEGPSMAAGAGGAGSVGGAGESPADEASQSPQQPGGSTPAEAPPQQPESPEPDAPSPTGEPEPPVEDVRVVDEFSIPHFVGDAETRRQLSALAMVGEDERADGGPVRSRRRGSGAPPEDAGPDYAKAREQALRARHVPPAERAFVKAYFDALVEAVR